MEFRYGLMDQNIKGNGKIIWQMVKESFIMLMVLFMMDR
jgi:hypothetical protein